MSLFDPELTFHWFNSWGGEGHVPFCHNITMNDQPAYEVPAPGLPFPPREKRAHDWPTKCVKSWLDGLLRWEQELLGSQGENSAEFPSPDGTLAGKPAKLLKVTTIGALRHTLECAYAYIRELEEDRRTFDASVNQNLTNQPNVMSLQEATDLHAKEEAIAKDRQLLADPKTPRKKFWAAYQRLALLPESKINKRADRPFNFEERRQHAHTGFLTELGELLDLEKKYVYYGRDYEIEGKGGLVEELGDILWYTAQHGDTMRVIYNENTFLRSKRHFGDDLYHIETESPNVELNLKHLIGDVAAGRFAVRDSYWPELFLVRDLFATRLEPGVLPPLREIARRNIAKLLDARYKSGSFSQEEAVNRDLADEAEKLRGTGVDGNNTRVPEPTEGFDASDAIPLAVITTAGTGQDPDTQAEFDPEDFNNERAEEGFAPDEPLDDDEYDDEMGSDLYEEYEED